ncbi:MAG: hypothetical protein IPP21_15740 [Betaproteobacteria bacterium]|nr:hypothetical protein [Betaproteobacteria bacterium]
MKAAETKVKQSQAQPKKAGDDARKAVLAAEKKLEATKRSTSEKLACRGRPVPSAMPRPI